jgi:hypothetical protein
MGYFDLPPSQQPKGAQARLIAAMQHRTKDHVSKLR